MTAAGPATPGGVSAEARKGVGGPVERIAARNLVAPAVRQPPSGRAHPQGDRPFATIGGLHWEPADEQGATHGFWGGARHRAAAQSRIAPPPPAAMVKASALRSRALSAGRLRVAGNEDHERPKAGRTSRAPQVRATAPSRGGGFRWEPLRRERRHTWLLGRRASRAAAQFSIAPPPLAAIVRADVAQSPAQSAQTLRVTKCAYRGKTEGRAFMRTMNMPALVPAALAETLSERSAQLQDVAAPEPASGSGCSSLPAEGA
eukprot:CAMPEP_0170354208 /NCGR_PEP_ID=MMETSP0116_2-20130129/78423_1 /TAXON_ID=400756 /ORGANISM="Durinskia baltica, Strain CSIRO CS-38" /LENGTH=259 /DNA_ID=CAMNT_0010608149 /DNA_START=316 /DNA_END=1093 /DNA_ORIENTATION=-